MAYIALNPKMMFYSIFLALFLSVCSISAVASDIILFVTTDGQQNQVNKSDLESYKSVQASILNNLKDVLKQSPLEQPKIVEVRTSDIQNLPKEIESLLAQGDKVKLVVFQGHGNQKEIVFDLKNRYEGKQLAEVFSDTRILNHLSNELSVYFPACSCGLRPSKNTPSFQEIFSEQFIEMAKENGKLFKLFQTIAHPNLFNGFALTPGLGYISLLIQKSGFFPIYQKLLLAGQRLPGKWSEFIGVISSGQIRSQLAMLSTIGLLFIVNPDSFEGRVLVYAPAIAAFALTYLELMQVGIVKNVIYKNGKIVKNDRALRPTLRKVFSRNSAYTCYEFYL